jgi:hypothetical protein
MNQKKITPRRPSRPARRIRARGGRRDPPGLAPPAR